MSSKSCRYLVLALLILALAGCQTALSAEIKPEDASKPCNPIIYSHTMLTRDGSESHLTAVCPDGTQKHRLTSDTFDNTHPAWSPDGSQIAFLSDRSSGTMQLHLMNAESGSIQQITSDLEDVEGLIWLPEGDQIALFAKTSDETRGWLVVDLATKDVRPAPGWPQDGSFRPAAFSHDGTRLVYLSLSQQGGHTSPALQIRVQNRDGSSDSALIPDIRDYRSPVWSPDDRQIAFLSDQVNPGEQLAVYVVDADGSDQQQVSQVMFSKAASLAWSPNGQKLAVNADQSLYVVDLNNRETQKLFTLEDRDTLGQISWQPVEGP